MQLLAAILIDAENIAPAMIGELPALFALEQRHGVSLVAKLIIGRAQALTPWHSFVKWQQFLSKTHAGGHNAADHLLQREAITMAHQGVRRIYLLTNDKGFVDTISHLQSLGCEVFGFGTLQASKRLQTHCDRFIFLPVTSNMHTWSRLHITGGPMSSLDPWSTTNTPEAENTQAALTMLYGSLTQPPHLTRLLFSVLDHIFSSLCLPHEEEVPRLCVTSPANDADLLSASTKDPLIAHILHHDPTLNTTWKAVEAFAARCLDAYHQGTLAAHEAFPHFPKQQFTTLYRDHLASLLAIWRYNPHAAPHAAQPSYPGYTPDHEQLLLERWFAQGFRHGIADTTT